MKHSVYPDVNPEPSRSMSELFGDLLADLQKLIRQEVALVRAEAKSEVRSGKRAAYLFLGRFLGIAVGGILLTLSAVYLLRDFAHLPIWSSLAIVGGFYFVVVGILWAIAQKRGGSI